MLTFIDSVNEKILNATNGVIVLTGGAATACHINDPNEYKALKCLDLNLYLDNYNYINYSQIHVDLQKLVTRIQHDMYSLIDSVRIPSPLVIFKCFQNEAYKFCNNIQLNLNTQVKFTNIKYNEEFDLVRFSVSVHLTSNLFHLYRNKSIQTFYNTTYLSAPLPLCANMVFLNVRIIKTPFTALKRCIRPLMFNYNVPVLTLQYVINEQLLCYLKDIFVCKFGYNKINRRLNRIKRLFALLPFSPPWNHHYWEENVYSFAAAAVAASDDSTICKRVEKILNAHGPVLGCRILLTLFLTTDMFIDALPIYVQNQINYPHTKQANQHWKHFMSSIQSIVYNNNERGLNKINL
ncbi:hypothetical protein [Lonomia obliqua multiple nucleopolyhedrovirus]|uniref:Uncharacterized protein n=1 Tax=Lonomia obliqua multiple nucleopolyhedrovirus TaxID=134394 RepID=A0A126FC91_9ABAC|nr:hypothetical protein [Lonomia obliqua multiple nucleopolyhedrovirus]AKN81011.1 hypothetical protein [Lonomia obliqua multiple nucleopolyhedrovirus]